MPHVTKLLIYLAGPEGPDIREAIGALPGYCAETFREHAKGQWHGEFVVSCPVAPNLADGDLVDDLAPHFPALLRLKTFYDAKFELRIAVGAPAAEAFTLESDIVASLAALGATIEIVTNVVV